ncbi:hypothetical protein, partial [Nonomuraea sp. SBT364]|uniref:hypothetical protein n=1 Tax=Nonomuraea sp. SBT364 TaxID=1580530 RepID=UPI00066DF779
SPPAPTAAAAGGRTGARRWVPVVTALLAAAAGVAATVAVLRPWEQAAGEPGTPAAASTVDALGSKLSIQVDSLARQGGTVRLQWTVRNVGEENAPLVGKLGGGALDSTVSRVNLIPPGVGSPIYPARENGACRCTDLPVGPFQGGNRVQLYAIYENVPEDVARVDIDMGPLGVVRNVAVTPS